MKSVMSFANSGGLVVGICNGFQVLTESGLLPGALIRNSHLRFSCKFVYLRVENAQTAFTNACCDGDILKMPIAHGEGNFYNCSGDIQKLMDNGQVMFRYVDAHGRITPEANPNGSADNIAGICNAERNVFGMMPHPERAVEPILGSNDGLKLFQSLVAARSAVGMAGKR
jgi:phosphoribosylformylglycinamidine synthase